MKITPKQIGYISHWAFKTPKIKAVMPEHFNKKGNVTVNETQLRFEQWVEKNIDSHLASQLIVLLQEDVDGFIECIRLKGYPLKKGL